MGRLQLLGISTLILCTSITAQVISANKKDLERAAELAVERAAEKAAERAVEKALNSGNSSTITVTVKESYSNAKKTAEEAAAPGSESTRPYDPSLYDRQYSHDSIIPDRFKNTSSEEEEDEDEFGSARYHEFGRSIESETSSELSVESVERVRSPISIPIKSSNKGFDKTEPELDFTADFDNLDINSDANFQGNFGLKSESKGRTKTFSRSYSAPRTDFPETKVEVDDHEDAEIFKMYATRLGKDGWSSAKQKGWVRHRPLWDDSKSRVDRDFWDGFRDMSASETKYKRNRAFQAKERIHRSDQFPQPLTTLSLDPKTTLSLYQMLQRQAESPMQRSYNYRNQGDGTKGPIKVYITIPVAYSPNQMAQKDQDMKMVASSKHFKKQLLDKGLLPPKKLLKRSYIMENGGLILFENENSHFTHKPQTFIKNPVYRSIIELPDSQSYI